jgi:hypothetical protein
LFTSSFIGDRTTNEVTVAMLLAVAQTVLATGVLRGNNLARVVLVLVLVANIVLNAIDLDENGIGSIVLSLLVIALVMCAGSYFRRGGPRWWLTNSRGGPGW